jgi:hypothetical protein
MRASACRGRRPRGARNRGPRAGNVWASQPAQNPTSAFYSALYGESCTTVTARTAVGDYVNASGTDVTLAESYSG